MHHYRSALHNLNVALDVMIEQGDTLIAASISYSVQLCETAISEMQATVIDRHREVDSD